MRFGLSDLFYHLEECSCTDVRIVYGNVYVNMSTIEENLTVFYEARQRSKGEQLYASRW